MRRVTTGQALYCEISGMLSQNSVIWSWG